MKKFLTRSLSIGGAIAAALVLTTASAPAATATWTVSPGGSFTASLSGGATFVMELGPSADVITCTSGVMSGTLTAGSGQTGGLLDPLGEITSVFLGSCTVGGVAYTLTANASSAAPWLMGTEGYTASLGITSLELFTPSTSSGTGLGFTMTGPGGCTVVFGGTTAVHGYLITEYQNSNGLLGVSDNTYRPSIHVISSTCTDWAADEGQKVFTTPVPQYDAAVQGGFAFNPIQTITSP